MSLAAFIDKNAATSPLTLHNATCQIATDYTKKKNVLRLTLSDGSEFLLMAASQNEMVEWLAKIQFYAGEYMLWDGQCCQTASCGEKLLPSGGTSPTGK